MRCLAKPVSVPKTDVHGRARIPGAFERFRQFPLGRADDACGLLCCGCDAAGAMPLGKLQCYPQVSETRCRKVQRNGGASVIRIARRSVSLVKEVYSRLALRCAGGKRHFDKQIWMRD